MLKNFHDKPFYKEYHYKARASEPMNLSHTQRRKILEYESKGYEYTISSNIEINQWVKDNFLEGSYKTSYSNCNNDIFYFKEKKDLDQFIKQFPIEIMEISVPFPDDSIYNKQKIKPKIWYGKYPYKFVIHVDYIDKQMSEGIYSHGVAHYDHWCRQNCRSDYRKMGISGHVSFFFLDPIDAMGFKIMFSDKIISTDLPDIKEVEKILKDRVKQAKDDLKTFKMGVST